MEGVESTTSPLEPIVENFENWPKLDASVSDDVVEKWILDNKRVLMRTITWNLAANPPPAIGYVTVNLLPKDRYFPVVIKTSSDRN